MPANPIHPAMLREFIATSLSTGLSGRGAISPGYSSILCQARPIFGTWSRIVTD